MGKFVIRKTNTGIKFDLKAGNGEVIATSEVYASEAACKNGVESVKKNAPVAAVENQTVEGYAAEKHPKFEVYTDKAGEFRFRLKATNGQVIAVSEGYKAIASCLNGIESVKKNAVDAEVVEGKSVGEVVDLGERRLDKVQKDDSIKELFTKDPVKAVEKVLGVDLPDDVVNKIIDAVKAKLTVDDAKQLFGALKKLF